MNIDDRKYYNKLTQEEKDEWDIKFDTDSTASLFLWAYMGLVMLIIFVILVSIFSLLYLPYDLDSTTSADEIYFEMNLLFHVFMGFLILTTIMFFIYILRNEKKRTIYLNERFQIVRRKK